MQLDPWHVEESDRSSGKQFFLLTNIVFNEDLLKITIPKIAGAVVMRRNPDQVRGPERNVSDVIRMESEQ
jgi:hypothetical protein